MLKQKIIASFISRRSTLPKIRYQRFLSTDKKESSTNAPELHKDHDLDHPPQEIDSSTGDKKEAVNEVPEIRRALASQYKERIQSSRVGRSADASTGAIPTANQRYFLVLTRLFKSPSDIPEYVP
uniref:Uncharacterized protein n=1 Tax=Panagrolaimus davidi TaxID=227884 RepID=A0A914QD74_9BILA